MNFFSEIDHSSFHLIYIGCAALALSTTSILRTYKYVKLIYGIIGLLVLALGVHIGVKTAIHGFIGYAIIGSAFFVLLNKISTEIKEKKQD